MSSSTILVIRATGSQGTAVLKNAQKNNITTRAYVTDKSAPRAQALLQYGAELYEGTLGDAPALEKALTGCDGVFLNQLPSFSDDTEVREAKVLLELGEYQISSPQPFLYFLIRSGTRNINIVGGGLS